MLIRSILVAVITLVVVFAHVQAADNNTVKGSYVVDEKTVQLKHAYSVKYVSEGKTYKSLLFSADAISEEDLKSDNHYSTLSGKASAGDVQALQVIFKPDNTLKMIHIYDQAFGNVGALQTLFGKFESTRFDDSGVTGKITMDSPKKFFEQTFQYNLSFAVNWAAP